MTKPFYFFPFKKKTTLLHSKLYPLKRAFTVRMFYVRVKQLCNRVRVCECVYLLAAGGYSTNYVILSCFAKNLPKPRAATSVATRMLDLPERNSRRTKSRSDCDLSPWIAPQRTPKLRMKRTRLSTRRLVSTKIIILPGFSLVSYMSDSRLLSLD